MASMVCCTTAMIKTNIFYSMGRCDLAFFDLHLNSTDGDTVFALDLNGPALRPAIT